MLRRFILTDSHCGGVDVHDDIGTVAQVRRDPMDGRWSVIFADRNGADRPGFADRRAAMAYLMEVLYG